MEHGYGRTVQRRARKGLLKYTNGSVSKFIYNITIHTS